MWLKARLHYSSEGTLADLSDADLSHLTDDRGRPLTGRRMTDAESLSPDGAGGWFVSFEQRHRIIHYPADGTVMALTMPDDLAQAPRNGGLETLTRLASGDLLAITEAHGTESQNHGWLSDENGWKPLTYRRKSTFRPTGAATLPDGSILICERSFTPFTGIAARIVHVEAAAVHDGATISGRQIAELRPPFNVDNMEAISTRRDESGRIFVYLLSDDNFSLLQRTLLMMFEWHRPAR